MNRDVAYRWAARFVTVRPDELRAMLWSFAYFFCLLAGYYVLRPLRDEMGIAGGVRNLPWLFSATFAVMLAAVPLFGALVTKLPRQRFIPIVYHFFVANIALFWLLLTLETGKEHVARVFFVWISVFSLFAVSVFWSFMADLFSSDQGKRLYGFIAAGGSAGALAGPVLTVWLAGVVGPINLLLVAAAFVEAAVFCAWRLEVAAGTRPMEEQAESKQLKLKVGGGLGGNWLSGLLLMLRSPYLAGIALWVTLLSLAGTFLYFQQANIIAAASDDPSTRTRIFASIDLIAGILTILVQFAATGRLISRWGTGPALAFLPLVFVLGFTLLTLTPALALVIGFQAIQRISNFAISNPAREVLFTVLGREEKYKAKNVIDIVVFRGADAASGWAFSALRALGLELSAISLATVPMAMAWLWLALALGRSQERQAHLSAAAPTPTALDNTR